jgi:hypothetical protein
VGGSRRSGAGPCLVPLRTCSGSPMIARTLPTVTRRRTPGGRGKRLHGSPLVQPWPGADPAAGPSLFLDQLGLWDAALESHRDVSGIGGPSFRAAGCVVRRIPGRGSTTVVAGFLARHHYTSGPGMRGLPFGLYRGRALLGVAVFARVCRPRWASENFVLLPGDRSRTAVQRRHLSVTEAEYVALSRLALAPEDADGAPLGNGAASWFLCRCLAGLEARNRALWSAHQRIIRGERVLPEHIRLLREAAGADRGRGRGYVKCVTTWRTPTRTCSAASTRSSPSTTRDARTAAAGRVRRWDSGPDAG